MYCIFNFFLLLIWIYIVASFFLLWIQECWHSFKPRPIPPPVFESQSVGLAFHIQNSFSVSILSRDGSGETHLLRKPPDRRGRFGNKGKHLDQEKQQKTAEGKRDLSIFCRFHYPNILNNLQNGTIPLFRSAGTSCTTFDGTKLVFLVIVEL